MKQKRKTDLNKGFSLVELVIVVAIMAILIGALVPQYSRYLDRTRLQKDNTAITGIADAVKIAMMDSAVNSATSLPATVTLTADADGNKVILFGASALEAELATMMGNGYETTSNAYRTSGEDIVIHIEVASATGSLVVSAEGWIESVGALPSATVTVNADGTVTVPVATATAGAGKVF